MRCMTDLLYCTLASGRNLNVYGNWFVRRYVRRGGVCDYCACTTAKCCRSEERNNNTNYNSNLVELSAHARFSVLSSRISRQQLSQRKKTTTNGGPPIPHGNARAPRWGPHAQSQKKVLPFTENVARHAQNAAGQTFLSPQWCALMAVNPREAMARVRCRPRADCPCKLHGDNGASRRMVSHANRNWQVAGGSWGVGERGAAQYHWLLWPMGTRVSLLRCAGCTSHAK